MGNFRIPIDSETPTASIIAWWVDNGMPTVEVCEGYRLQGPYVFSISLDRTRLFYSSALDGTRPAKEATEGLREIRELLGARRATLQVFGSGLTTTNFEISATTTIAELHSWWKGMQCPSLRVYRPSETQTPIADIQLHMEGELLFLGILGAHGGSVCTQRVGLYTQTLDVLAGHRFVPQPNRPIWNSQGSYYDMTKGECFHQMFSWVSWEQKRHRNLVVHWKTPSLSPSPISLDALPRVFDLLFSPTWTLCGQAGTGYGLFDLVAGIEPEDNLVHRQQANLTRVLRRGNTR